MRIGKRFLALVLAVSMLLTSDAALIHASQIEESSAVEIVKQDINNAEVLAGTKIAVLYNPAGQKPLPKVVYGDNLLVEGEDFEAIYYQLNESGERVGIQLDSVTNVGTYELVLRGMNDFSGELQMASVITVQARSFGGGAVRIENAFARYDDTNGNITSNCKLWYQGILLKEDEDYRIAEKIKNEDNGHATFVFEGMGNYSGRVIQQFLVISNEVVLSEGQYKIADIENQEYTGERKTPEISIVNEEGEVVELQKDVDYTVSYKYNLNVGTATVIVTGRDKCVGELRKEFEIIPADIGNIMETESISVPTEIGIKADISANEFVYNGGMLKPAVSVTMKESKLKEGTDYSVSYQDKNGNPAREDAGTYYAVITLQGNYAGTITFVYEILPVSLENVTISVPDYIYTGEQIIPTVDKLEISIDGTLLPEDKKAGVTVKSVEANMNATPEAVIRITGEGNFTGEVSAVFKIVPRDIKDECLDITLGGHIVTKADTGYQTEWNGNAQTPEVMITNGEKTLVLGKDYSLIYRYNTAIGTARVIISGRGNYQGTYILFFEITGMKFSEESGIQAVVEEGTYYYTGEKITPSVEVSENGKAWIEDVDYSVTYTNNVNAGTATVIVTGIGAYEGSISKSFTILPKTIGQAQSVKVSDIKRQRYTRELIVPDIFIEIDGKKLIKGKDYTVTAFNEIEAGIGTLQITGIGNYKGILAEPNFEIYKTTITYVLNGGVNSTNNPDYYTATDAITLSSPTKENYIFMGWYSDKACTKKVTGIKVGSDGNKKFYAKWTPKQVQGIDISYYQNMANKGNPGVIDFKSVKAEGKTFAMVRICDGTTLDTHFEYNYSGARNAGIKVGVYCYNRATTVERAVIQANFVLEKLKGRKLDYPVCLDMEGDYSSVGKLTDAERTDIVFAFKNVVEAAGYEFILYANKNWMDNYFDNDRLAPLDLWIARYCDYSLGHRYTGKGNVRIWQYSSKGAVSGISGNVDLDVCYEDYVRK